MPFPTLGSAEEITRLRFCFSNLTAESNIEPYRPSVEPWRYLVREPSLERKIETALDEASFGPEWFAGLFSDFHTALAAGTPAPLDLADARVSIELATAIYHSAATGTDVALPLTKYHPLYQGW